MLCYVGIAAQMSRKCCAVKHTSSLSKVSPSFRYAVDMPMQPAADKC